MSTIFTPDEYVHHCILTYPSLYAKSTFELAKLAVFDQLFNVIGNGIKDENLFDHLSNTNSIDMVRSSSLIGKDLYWGYTKTIKYPGDDYEWADTESESIIVPDDERANHPEIKLWVECSYMDTPFSPYCNFQSKYSMVYGGVFKTLPKEWHEAAIWFYEKSREFFTNKSEHYHYAYPSHSKRKDERLIYDLEKYRLTYPSDEAFGNAYEVPFYGDFDDFARRRWNIEKTRILEFIDDTIKMIHGW